MQKKAFNKTSPLKFQWLNLKKSSFFNGKKHNKILAKINEILA